MAADRQELAPVEIVLEGMDQKTGALLRAVGKLDEAINVDFDKTGAINKRRGMSRQPLANLTAVSEPAAGDIRDLVYLRTGTHDDELLAFGYDYLYALGSRTGGLGSGGRRWIYRGPLARGQVRVQRVAVSSMTDVAEESALLNQAAFAGLDMCDVAALTANGTFYRCYCCYDRANDRVLAICFAEIEAGQWVLVFREVVAAGEVSGEGFSLTNVDCPRIIAVGTTFFVHWLAYVDPADPGIDWSINLATRDMATITASTAFTQQGSISTHGHGLYDVFPFDATRYLVVHKNTSGTGVEVRMQNGTTWAQTAWTATILVTISAYMLGCYANATDDVVVVTYQSTAVGLPVQSTRYVGTTGAGATTATTFTTFGNQATFVACGHARIAANLVAVCAEVQDLARAPNNLYRAVAFRRISSASAATVGNEHYIPNVSMCSRPFGYQSGRALSTGSSATTGCDIYLHVAFKSIGMNTGTLHTWEQRRSYVVNLDVERWDDVVDGAGLRGRVVANLGANGGADGRPAGATPAAGVTQLGLWSKRVNHVSSVSGAPATGVDCKTRTFAAVTWNRITQRRVTDTGFGPTTVSEFVPTNAGVVGYRFHLEEPWVYRRDASDAAEPSANFNGCYPFSQYEHAKAGRGLAIGGACPSMYDGQRVTEIGYPWYPEIVALSAAASGGVGVTTGVHWWCVTYEWRDNAGQVVRSRPSRPMRLDVGNPNPTDRTISITVRCSNLSLKDAELHAGTDAPVNMVLWRTTVAQPTTFYRVHSSESTTGFRIESTPINDPEAYAMSIVDTLDDDEIEHGDVLPYTFVSGVSSNFLPVMPPAARAMTVWRNRVWLASAEDPREIWYSAEILPAPGDTFNVQPEFHFENRFVMGDLGEIVAMHPMEDELVIFTRDAIYKLGGEGNSLGVADSSLQIAVIHEGTGCIEPRSVVLGPPGVFFQSAKGVYLYGRGRELDFLTAGAAVEDLVRTCGNLRSGTLLEDRHQIRWTCNRSPTNAPTVIVYDYFNRQWSEHRLTNAMGNQRLSALNGGTAWRGTSGEHMFVALAQGCPMIERSATDANPYGDEDSGANVQSYAMRLQLNWLHLAGMAGLKRIREILYQVTQPTGYSGELNLQAWYDVTGEYDDSGAADESWTWAAPAPNCGKAPPRVQKLTAIKLLFFEGAGASTTVAPVVNSISLLAAVKPGTLRKVPNTAIGA